MTRRSTRGRRAWVWPYACALIALGCGGGDDAGAGVMPLDVDNPGANPGGGSGSGPGSGASGSGASGSGASSTGDPWGSVNGAAACKHVDVVIAVDGSSSMTEELEAMRATVFPAFAQRLATLGAGLDDFRVATLDACRTPANFHTRGVGAECGFQGGQPWIESSSSALDAEFACVGDIYLEDQECSGDNDDEEPATTAAIALAEPNASGPNAGFRRDDALLIVVAITDEDEQPTGDDPSPEEVYAQLSAAAGSDPRRMVFLGIGGASQCAGAYGDAEQADELQQIVDLFAVHDRGVFWDLCQGQLEDGLDQAFRVIERACDGLCDDLDEDCGGPPDKFCLEIPDDPACRVD